MTDELLLHEWYVNEDGKVEYFDQDMDGYHAGPKCIRCNQTFCISCQSNVSEEPCSNQDLALFEVVQPKPKPPVPVRYRVYRVQDDARRPWRVSKNDKVILHGTTFSGTWLVLRLRLKNDRR